MSFPQPIYAGIWVPPAEIALGCCSNSFHHHLEGWLLWPVRCTLLVQCGLPLLPWLSWDARTQVGVLGTCRNSMCPTREIRLGIWVVPFLMQWVPGQRWSSSVLTIKPCSVPFHRLLAPWVSMSLRWVQQLTWSPSGCCWLHDCIACVLCGKQQLEWSHSTCC